MAVFKKGSKGKDVENIQNLLNKAKVGPKLKLDGVFGDLTDKQVRAFQKRCKLKPDGKVDEYTLAALKFGGPLPEMTVEDYSKLLRKLGEIRKYHKYLVNSYQNTVNEFAKFAQISARESALALKLVEENQAHWDKSVGLAGQVVTKQAEFKAILKKSPGKAEKLVKECETLQEQGYNYYEKNIQPNVSKVDVALKAIRQAMESAQKVLDDQRAANKKASAAVEQS